jgi:NADH:ubiquinone oxidoreductase subunit 5 (subunit L)/multisubunit Na+/H+ antiporter MnhA subunit
MLTRLLVLCAQAALRMAPLLALAVHGRRALISPGQWIAALLATVALQVYFAFVAHRCSSEPMPHGRGLAWIGAAMSTGWLYIDVLSVLLAVAVAMLASCVLAPLPGARTRYVEMVLFFERHRLRR